MHVLTYSKGRESLTYNESGRALCTNTMILQMDFDKMVTAYTDVCGGEWESNYADLSLTGFREDCREDCPAPSIQMIGESINMIFVSEKITQETEKRVLQLSRLYD